MIAAWTQELANTHMERDFETDSFTILATKDIRMGEENQECRHFAVCLFVHTERSQKGRSIFSRSTGNGPCLSITGSRAAAFTGEAPALFGDRLSRRTLFASLWGWSSRLSHHC